MNVALILQQSLTAVVRKVCNGWTASVSKSASANQVDATCRAGISRPMSRPANCSASWSNNRPATLAAHRRVATPALPIPKAKPLRVLRFVDSSVPRTSVGRMVMSGSMADVCAELDRLAAQELAVH